MEFACRRSQNEKFTNHDDRPRAYVLSLAPRDAALASSLFIPSFFLHTYRRTPHYQPHSFTQLTMGIPK
jgi:hypothetical protein